ncbi:hypothetical protein MC885_002089, partial [Smutsia gigantea]
MWVALWSTSSCCSPCLALRAAISKQPLPQPLHPGGVSSSPFPSAGLPASRLLSAFPLSFPPLSLFPSPL